MKRSALFLLLMSSSLGQSAGTANVPVTVVAGESWLAHLHRPFNTTSMGKTWRVGPTPNTPTESTLSFQPSSQLPTHFAEPTVILRGVDLYRMNCRACHGESGLGAPPEIGSVVNPVRATSVPLVLQRMNGLGMAIGRKQAGELAGQAMNSLLDRLHKGGQDMPAFPYLREAEVRSLVAYLKQLAGVPGAELSQVAVKESPERVGELMVKSTCHICHDATGSNPRSEQLLAGAIPPLSSLTTLTTQAQLVRKVTLGAPINMGAPPMPYRGRMPVLYYFSTQEAADVYIYLSRYPPYKPATLALSLSTASEPINIPPPPEVPVLSSVVMLIGVGWVALLMGGCAWITVREFRRLSAESAARRTPAQVLQPSQLITAVKARAESPGADSTAAGWATLRKKIS